MSRDRGLSEALGFFLAFSVVITGVALVYVGGFGAVTDLAGSEQDRNAVYAMSVVGGGVEEVRAGRAYSRESTVNLRGGTLSLDGNASLGVSIAGAPFDRTYDVGRLRYRTDDLTVALEGGAVVARWDRWAVVDGPPLSCAGGVAVVPVVALEGANVSTGGESVVQVRSTVANRSVAFPSNRTGVPGNTSVTVTPPSPADGAWSRWLADAGWTDADDDGAWTCGPVRRVSVTHVTVTVSVTT